MCSYDPVLYKEAATIMRKLPEYTTDPHKNQVVNYFVWIMSQLDPSPVPYVPILILKCTTIRLGLNVANWGTMASESDPMECPFFAVAKSLSEIFVPSNINYGLRFSFASLCARTICKNDSNGHCLGWS